MAPNNRSRGLDFAVKVHVRYVASLLVAVSVLVSGAANAKCSYFSTTEGFSDADSVVLAAIIDARDGPVPWPYGLSKGALPGRLLKLRVVSSWKGSLRPEDVIYGWTLSPRIEDAYPHTEAGTQIIVFWAKDSHELMACNAAGLKRLDEVSQELDAIVRRSLTMRSRGP